MHVRECVSWGLLRRSKLFYEIVKGKEGQVHKVMCSYYIFKVVFFRLC